MTFGNITIYEAKKSATHHRLSLRVDNVLSVPLKSVVALAGDDHSLLS